MKTLYTFPVALLMMAAYLGTATPAAAEAPTKTFRVTFAYNAKAPATEIYSSLQKTARKACDKLGAKAVRMAQVNRACSKEVVAAGVKALKRTDIAMLHDGRRFQLASR